MRKALPFVPEGARVLDIGCSEGELFELLGSSARDGVGLDPDLPAPVVRPGYRLYPGSFPGDLPEPGPYDAIVMLAVLEHIPAEAQDALAEGCSAALRPGGRLIITTPSPFVDRILDFLAAIRLIDGMSLEEHHGFEPRDALRILSGRDWELEVRRRFQLGLNHLFVFRKREAAA